VSEWPETMTVKPIITWPGGQHSEHVRSNFSAPWSATLDLLDRELWMLAARDVVLQVAIDPQQFRIDGKPRASAKQLHPGVILTMTSKHGDLSYPCDTYATWRENLRAIALALEALRKVDRYGVTAHGEQYRGFLALEAASTATVFSDWQSAALWLDEEFGDPTVSHSVAWLVGRGKRATHPDTGGDAARFDLVMKAESLLRKAGRL
jgi:hypothetical protein